jgi:hypothetical protein
MTMNDRYSFMAADKGALLLDRHSGHVMELNESAAFIWKRYISGDPPQAIADALARIFEIDLKTATADVNRTLAISDEAPLSPPTDFRYEPTTSGYLFLFRGCPTFQIDRFGSEVALSDESTINSDELSSVLHALSPKVLALRGHIVLHAASVEIAGRILAFAGLSGAGKSTSAQAMAQAGALLVSEDQLPISLVDARAMVPLEGERIIQSWISKASEDLRVKGRASCTDLDAVARGEQLPLAEIGFLQRERRTTDDYVFSELDALGTASSVFRHVFYGADSRDAWDEALKIASALGASVAGAELSFPAGLEKLPSVARRLTAAGTFRA